MATLRFEPPDGIDECQVFRLPRVPREEDREPERNRELVNSRIHGHPYCPVGRVRRRRGPMLAAPLNPPRASGSITDAADGGDGWPRRPARCPAGSSRSVPEPERLQKVYRSKAGG